MSSLLKQLNNAAGTLASSGGVTVEDNFSIFLASGTGGADLTATINVDLATDGGIVWKKQRNGIGDNQIFNAEDTGERWLVTNSTAEEASGANYFDWNTDGFTDKSGDSTANDYVYWTLKKAPNFFDVQTGAANGSGVWTFNHDLESTPGTVVFKRIDSSGGWTTWHKSLTNTTDYYLQLNSTAAEASSAGWISVSDTSITVTTGVPSGQFVAYLFAHDPLEDGMIQCGSFTGNTTSGVDVSLGWEPQWLLVKNITNGSTHWGMMNTMMGMTADGSCDRLLANSSAAESNNTWITPTADGFHIDSSVTSAEVNGNGNTIIYIAIRRPMKTPTSSSEVFAIDTQISAPRFTVGFPADMVINKELGVTNWVVGARLIGPDKYLQTDTTSGELTNAGGIQYDLQNDLDLNFFGAESLVNVFKRATGFFDVVCYTGDGIAGRTVNHNLGVVPEMMWVKERTSVGYGQWYVYSEYLGNTKFLQLESNYFEQTLSTIWNNTTPNDIAFTLGSNISVNGSTGNFIAFLFATLPGISKVGSYTGNGTSQTIDCGFSAGTKFLIIKRTDSTGNWNMFDSTRGIITGNSPRLELNTTDAEDTGDDGLDPANSGFSVNYIATDDDDVNISGAEYVYYAISQ